MANIFKNILSLPENFARSIAPRAAEASDERRQSVALANDQKEMLLNAMNEVKNAPNPQAQLEAIRKNQAILQAMDLFNMSEYQKSQTDIAKRKQAIDDVGGTDTPYGREVIAAKYGINDPNRIKKDLLPSQQIQQHVLDAIGGGKISENLPLLQAASGGTNITNILGGKQMTEGQIQRLSTKQAFLDIGKQVMDLWQKDYTGPIEGRITWLKNKLGGGTRDQAKFAAGVASMLETMYQRAGKQLSDKEIEKWQPYLPSINDPDEAFPAKMEFLIDNVATYLEKEVSLAGSQGYRTSGSGVLSTVSPSPGKEKSISEMTDEELQRLLEE